MTSFQFIKPVFIAFVTIFWGFSSCAQITDPLQKEAETTLRAIVNKIQPDTDKIEAELNLAQLYLYAGVNKRSFLDSTKSLNFKAEVLCRQLHSAKWLKEVIQSKAAYYFEIGDSITAETCVMEAIKSTATSHDILAQAHAWSNIGYALPSFSNALLQGKIICLNYSIKLFKQLNHQVDAITAFKDVADTHMTQGKLDLAEIELLLVLKLYKASHFQNLSSIYYLLSKEYRYKGNMHQALYYGIEAIKNIQHTQDYEYANAVYVGNANLYEDLGMYDDALLYYKKLLDKSHGDNIETCVATKHITILLLKENKKNEALAFLTSHILNPSKLNFITSALQSQALAICYLSLGHYQQAGLFTNKMMQAAGEYHYLLTSPLYAKISIYIIACNFYVTTKQYKQAKYYLQQLQAIPNTSIIPVSRCDMELYQSKIDSAEGNQLLALKHFQAYKNLSDSIFNATKSKQIEELHISYETRQKDADLTLLKKQSQIQKASIANKNLETKFIIIGFVSLAIVLAIIIIGLYNRFTVNKRYNIVLEGNQREIAAKNITLEKLLVDNEWLLREVHHRVKNNLHIITGLLQSQSAYLEDGIALDAVRDSRNRVQSMALIHQKLYMTPATSEIYLPEFVTELVDNLKESFDTRLNIYFQLEIAQVVLDASYVVPIGLILNEAITNAIKHAFPYSDNDTIKVTLINTNTNEVSITIADNGKGLSRKSDSDPLKSFGLQLISGLVRELSGDLTIEGPPGTTLSINFKTILSARPSL